MVGIMLDDSGDLLVRPRAEPDGKLKSGLVIDDTLIQDAAIVLGLTQGELKEDPALGPNLIRYIRSSAQREKIEKQMQIHLKRAGIDYEDLIGKIQLQLNNETE